MTVLCLLRTVSSVGLGEPPGQDRPWYPTFISRLIIFPLQWKTSFAKFTSYFLCQGSSLCFNGCLEYGTTLWVSVAFVCAVRSSLHTYTPFPSRKLIFSMWKAKQVRRSLQFVWVSCSLDRKWVRNAADTCQPADILQDNYRPVMTNDVPTNSL